MNCTQAREAFNAAILQQLSTPEQADFEAHLGCCRNCQAEYEALGAQLALPAPTAGRGQGEGRQRVAALEERVLAAGKLELAGLRPLQKGEGRRQRFWAFATAGAAAAALLLVLFHFQAQENPPGLPESEDVSGNEWSFVDGDSANSRNLGGLELGMPARVLWEKKIAGVAGTYKPLAWKGLVIIGSAPAKFPLSDGGGLTALEAGSGKVVWQKTFAEGDYFKAKGFPDRCLLDGRLYVTDGRVCRVFDAVSGEATAVYSAPEPQGGWSYLAAAQGRLYGGSHDGRTVFCIVQSSGKTVWSRAAGGHIFIPALSGNRLYLQTSDGDVAALDATDGHEIWRQKDTAPKGKAAVYAAQDRILVLANSDELAGFDAASGQRLWLRKIPLVYQAGLALGRDAAYILAGRAAVDLGDGHILWQRTEAKGGLCTPPTVAGSRLFASTGKKSGSLNVLTASGELLSATEDAERETCDGAIVCEGRIFTVGGGRFLALTCR
ncbi:MAG: PQQ-binding-like beta-propeller repeat protein [Planctomycetota bacterium]